MRNKCDTCDDSGYMWCPGPDGRDWMCDCDNEECNAFGQMDDNEHCDKCEKAHKLPGGQWHCVEHGEEDI